MKIYSVSLMLLLIFVFAAGCGQTDSNSVPEDLADLENLNVYPSDTPVQGEITFNQTQVFGETDSVKFGLIRGLAVDESGRVIISEISEGRAALHVFESEASYLASLGNYGDGPGEFRSAISSQIHNDLLYILDGSTLKINIYSLQTLSFERSIQLDPREWSHIDELKGTSAYDFHVIDNNRILLAFLKSEGRRDLLYRYMINGSGEIISDKILEQVLAEHFVVPDNGGIVYSPFSSNGLITLTENDQLYTVWTEDILFKQYTMEGDYLSAFYHPFTNSKLSRQEVLNHQDGEIYEAAVRNTGFPDAWPAIHSVVVDNSNNFWVSTITDSDETYEWWVLKTDGDIRTKFQWPRIKRIKSVTDEMIYALETDPATGIQTIVTYDFSIE